MPDVIWDDETPGPASHSPSAAKAAPKDVVWDDEPAGQPTHAQQPEPSVLGSLGRKLVQGASAGLGDEWGAFNQKRLAENLKYIPAGLGDKLRIETRYADEVDPEETYKQATNEQRRELARDAEVNPIASVIGEGLGTAFTGAILGPGRLVAGAMGALSGYGHSDAEDTKGQVIDTAGGAALSLLGNEAGRLIGKGAQGIKGAIAKPFQRAADAATEELDDAAHAAVEAEVNSARGALGAKVRGGISGQERLAKRATDMEMARAEQIIEERYPGLMQELDARGVRAGRDDILAAGEALAQKLPQVTQEGIESMADKLRSEQLGALAGKGGSRLKELAIDTLGSVPIIGPPAKAVINAGRSWLQSPASRELAFGRMASMLTKPGALGRYAPMLAAAGARSEQSLRALHEALLSKDPEYGQLLEQGAQ